MPRVLKPAQQAVPPKGQRKLLVTTSMPGGHRSADAYRGMSFSALILFALLTIVVKPQPRLSAKDIRTAAAVLQPPG
jgi:hypothetical protein